MVYSIVAGERRFRAIQQLAWQTIPCIIRPVSDEDVFEVSVLENVARQQMNPVEEAAALQQLLNRGLDPRDIERRLGIGSGDGGEVRWKVKLLGAYDTIQHLVSRGQFPVTMAVQLSRLSDYGQRKAFGEWRDKNLSQNAFTALVDSFYAQENQRQMFPETRLDDETKAKADRLMVALRNLERHAATIGTTDLALIGQALFHRDGEIAALCDAGIAALTRIRKAVQRTEGRVSAVRLFDEAPMD